VPTKLSAPMLPKCTTMLITPKSDNRIRTLPLRRIFHPITIPLKTTRLALQVAVIVAARITAAAEIVVVTVAATVVVADVGDGVADVNVVAGGALRARAWADAICLPPNMLRRKASPVATTIEVTITVARTTVVATSEARKIAAARRVVSNLVVLRSAALTIARLKLPVPPHPALLRKNPFFSQASL
jgi:hypothetical protein